MLSLPVAADLLGIDHSTMYRRVKAGEIPHVRIGRTYGVRHSDLIRLRDDLVGRQGHPRPNTGPIRRPRRPKSD